MTLKKPPLVEVWMSFRFEPAADAPIWTRERYQEFLNAVADTHPRVEEMARHSIRVEMAGRSKKPQIKEIGKEVLAVRAFTEEGTRAVQLTPDGLLVNYLRAETEPYPGFSALLDEAVAHCRRYLECYRPNGISEAALHYVDVIELPLPEDGILRTERYLNLNFNVPEAVFGYFHAFELKAVVCPPKSPEFVELVFATEPALEGNPHRRFRLEWHTAARADALMTEDTVREKLQVAHDRLWMCFCHAFTPEGWALFEPEKA